MPGSEGTLPLDAAYEAARVRAVKTTDALMLAEGQILDLQRRLAEVTEERDRFAGMAEQLLETRARRRARDARRRARRRAEGVSDAAEDPCGYAYAVGQAD
jgi:hypothetical protein